MGISWKITSLDNDQYASGEAQPCWRQNTLLLSARDYSVSGAGWWKQQNRDWNMKDLLSDGGKIHVVLEFLRITIIFDYF